VHPGCNGSKEANPAMPPPNPAMAYTVVN